jgi:hypothetical protein
MSFDGLPWQRLTEAQISQIKTVAVFVGKNSLAPWQYQERDAFLREFVRRGWPLIPVLLADAPQEPTLPVFPQVFFQKVLPLRLKGAKAAKVWLCPRDAQRDVPLKGNGSG